jgi:hypothetical protein
MCAVVLTRSEEDGSKEAPSTASEFLPGHGAGKEVATDQLEPVCQGAEGNLLVLQPEVPAEAGGENRGTRFRGVALRQVRRHFAVHKRMGWHQPTGLGWGETLLAPGFIQQPAESRVVVSREWTGHGRVASEICWALIRLAESMEQVGANQQA